MSFEKNFGHMFIIALSNVDPHASPGDCQLSNFGSTNAQVLGYDSDGFFNVERVKLLYDLVKFRMVQLLGSEPVADPIRLFVKREPHKAKKLEEGRLRLISSVSLIDSFVDRILFQRLQMNQIDKVGKTPIMVGWSPAAGGYRMLSAMCVAREDQDYLMIDKTAWDWTVKGWMTKALRDIIINLSPGAPDWWIRIVKNRFKLLFRNPIFSFGDGSRAKQQVPGLSLIHI